MYSFEVMIKSITNFLIIFLIFQQLQSHISQIEKNGYNPFCDETLKIQVIESYQEKNALPKN